MSSRAIIWTVVVIVVLVVLGWYFWGMHAGQTPSTQSMATTTSATTTASASGSGTTQATTLHSVMTQGGNYTCTIETTTSGSDTTGTIYGANGETRLDLSINQDGTMTTTHIIRANGYSYTWVDGQQTGIKEAITSSSPTTVQEPGQGGVITVSDNSTLSSTCHPWIPDATQFVPPTGITFSAQ